MTVMVISFILTILPVVGITQHFPACLVTTSACRLPVWSKQSGHPPSLPDARYTNPHLGLLEMQDPMLEDVIQLAKVSQPGCEAVLVCGIMQAKHGQKWEEHVSFCDVLLAALWNQGLQIECCSCASLWNQAWCVHFCASERAVINTFEIAFFFFFVQFREPLLALYTCNFLASKGHGWIQSRKETFPWGKVVLLFSSF